MFTNTLLVDQIVDTIEILRTQLEGNLDQNDTANTRGRILGMKAVLAMIKDQEKAKQ